MRIFLASLLLSLANLLYADWQQGAKELSQGNRAAALETLAPLPESPERNFWYGRALIDEGQYLEAVELLKKIQPEHELYPFAAKALIYCAWQGNENALEHQLEQLSHSSSPEVAQLAQAAQLEKNLLNANDPAILASSLASWKEAKRAQGKQEQGLESLFEIELLRVQGKHEQALQMARNAAQDTNLPLLIREHARLATARIYYSMEDHEAHNKGEETLLQFLATSPNSPLLDEAFRLLNIHRAFERGNYAINRLNQWTAPEELSKSARAVRCMLILNSLKETTQGDPPDLSYTNSAIANCPKEPATRGLVIETLRRLLAAGDKSTAEQYFKLIENEDYGAYASFFRGLFLLENKQYDKAVTQFLRSANIAPPDLRQAALANALISALKNNKDTLSNYICTFAQTPSERNTLLSLVCAYCLSTNKSLAEENANQIIKSAPKSSEAYHAQLDLVYIQLEKSPGIALSMLNQLYQEQATFWTDEHIERYISLLIAAISEAKKAGISIESNTIPDLISSVKEISDEQLKINLSLRLSRLLYSLDLYSQSRDILLELARKNPRHPSNDLMLYEAARACAKLNTRQAIMRGIRLQKQCVHLNSPLKTRALIECAALHVRLGQEQEAHAILTPILQRENLSAIEECLAQSVRADAWAISAAEELADSQLKALAASATMLDDEKLPRAWKIRALMQHATLCVRFAHHDQAIASYQRALDLLPTSKLSLAHCYILYHAASGAIDQLVSKKRYSEAINLALKIAKWDLKHENDTPSNMAKKRALVQHFSEWANLLRQEHGGLATEGQKSAPKKD